MKMLGTLGRLRKLAGMARRDVLAIYFAARDPRTPMGVRLLALIVAAYALSPIDLIPDFIPVLGQLDDLLLVPLGLWLVARLSPPQVMDDARRKARAVTRKPRLYLMAALFVALWLLAAWGLYRWLVN